MKTTDLAMARANGHARQQTEEIKSLDIGDGWGFLGFQVQPQKSKDGEVLGAILYAVGTRQSLIAQTQMKIVRVPVAPIAEVKIENLRKAFAAASGETQEPEQ